MAPVNLYVYDLSQGMARTMSLALVGKQIDAIWHTSIVVFDREYYFGQGIIVDEPGKTPHGSPLEIVHLGETELPYEVFLEYIDNLRQVFTADKYHLLNNNCNSFTNEVSLFLVGKPIPSHITGLPEEFAQTQLGRTLVPLIDAMFSSRTRHVTSTIPAGPHMTEANIRSVSSELEMRQIIMDSYAVVVNFSSQHCPPCRVIAPEFARSVEDLTTIAPGSWGAGSKGLVALKVDITASQHIAQTYGVQAAPTFQAFVKGSKIDEFRGANVNSLRRMIELVMREAYPPHKHVGTTVNLPLSIIKPFVFDQANLDAITQKIMTLDYEPEDLMFLGRLISFLKRSGPLDKNWLSQIETLYFSIADPSKLFPIIDLFRLIIIHKESHESLITSQCTFLLKVIQHCKLPPALLLMILRAISNMLACPKLAMLILDETPSVTGQDQDILIPPSNVLVHCLLSHLVEASADTDQKIHNAISTILYNVAVGVSSVRQTQRGMLEKDMMLRIGWESEIDEPEHVLELVSAIIHVISNDREFGHEALKRLLTALLYFLYLAPGETLLELCSVMDVSAKLDLLCLRYGFLKDLCEDIKKLL